MSVSSCKNSVGIPPEKVCFSFKYFQKHSIRVNNDFNNFYETRLDSINAVQDLFETIIEMSKFNRDELFSNEIKNKFHLKNITNDNHIDRIEKVLREGYSFPDKLIEQFERTYTEFDFKDGKRVIAATLYGSLFEFLFLDPNHMICIDSSRFPKKKNTFSVKSTIEGWTDNDLTKKEPLDVEYIDMLVDDYEHGRIISKDEFIEQYKELREEYVKL